MIIYGAITMPIKPLVGFPMLDLSSSYVHWTEPNVMILDFGESMQAPAGSNRVNFWVNDSTKAIASSSLLEGDDHKIRAAVVSSLNVLDDIEIEIQASSSYKDVTNKTAVPVVRSPVPFIDRTPTFVPGSSYAFVQEPNVVVIAFDTRMAPTGVSEVTIKIDGSPVTVLSAETFEGDIFKVRLTIDTAFNNGSTVSFTLGNNSGLTNLGGSIPAESVLETDLTLIPWNQLDIPDSTHPHTSDAVHVTQVQIIPLSSTSHSQESGRSSYTQDFVTSVRESTHQHIGDSIVLSTPIFISEPVHLIAVDNVTISQIHDLKVVSTGHVHTADFMFPLISISQGQHTHVVDSVSITQVHDIRARESSHSHTAYRPAVNKLKIRASDHNHISDRPNVPET